MLHYVRLIKADIPKKIITVKIYSTHEVGLFRFFALYGKYNPVNFHGMCDYLFIY